MVGSRGLDPTAGGRWCEGPTAPDDLVEPHFTLAYVFRLGFAGTGRVVDLVLARRQGTKELPAVERLVERLVERPSTDAFQRRLGRVQFLRGPK